MQENKVTDIAPENLDRLGLLIEQGQFELLLPKVWEAADVRLMDTENLHRRLRKIIGQVQAIDRMIDEDVPCEDVLSQMNAVKSAMHKCGQIVMEGHINNCVREGIEHGDADATIAKFTKVVERFANMK